MNTEQEIKQEVIDRLKGTSEIIIMDEAGKTIIYKTQKQDEELEWEIQSIMLDLKEGEWIDEIIEWR